MELLFVLYKTLICLLTCKAVKNIQNKKSCHNFWKIYDFSERLKDSTQRKHSCAKTFAKAFDVRHDAKHYRVSQVTTGSFVYDSKFYDEEWNELS